MSDVPSPADTGRSTEPGPAPEQAEPQRSTNPGPGPVVATQAPIAQLDAAPPPTEPQRSTNPGPGPVAAPAPAPPAIAPPEPVAPPPPAISARVQALLTRLGENDGAGPDLRYDRDHEVLRNEVGKLEALSGGNVNWNMVAEVGTKMLATRSKDLLIATYVANAFYVQGGLASLPDALDLVTSICDGFWDAMHPNKARLRGRAAAVGWLIGRLDLGLPDHKVVAADRETLAKARDAAKRFATMVRDRFEEAAPSPRPILDHLERHWLSLPPPAAPAPATPATPSAPTAAPQPTATTAAPAATASVQLSTATVTLADASQARDFLTKSGAALTQAASTIFGAAPGDPLSYRLRRIGLYLPILDAPPPTSGLRTGLPPLPAPVRAQLETLAKNQKWDALLAEAEPTVGAHRFALDLHRYVAIALEGLGHTDARDAVIHEIRALVARLPRLFELEHSDGAKLASEPTRALFAPPTGGGGGGASEDNAAIEEAKSLAAGGKLHEALEALTKAQVGAAAGRDRFRMRLAMAKACVACGAQVAADGMLAALANDAASHGLDHWEPALAAEVYATHYECLRALGKEGRDVEARRAAVYVRLCAVAPAIAAKLA